VPWGLRARRPLRSGVPAGERTGGRTGERTRGRTGERTGERTSERISERAHAGARQGAGTLAGWGSVSLECQRSAAPSGCVRCSVLFVAGIASAAHDCGLAHSTQCM